MKQQPHVLTEEEIINKLQEGVGKKKFKILFAKLLRRHGLSPMKHFLFPKWEENSEYSMHWSKTVQQTYGFQRIVEDMPSGVTEEYSSLIKREDISSETAEHLFFWAAEYNQ